MSEPHLSEQVLTDFVLGYLSEQEVRKVSSHIDSCETCSAAMEQTETDDNFSRLVRRVGRKTKAEPKDGAVVGPYLIRRRLGAGGMGVVYLARHLSLERQAAVKILPSVFLAVPERKARFQREIRALARLDHPQIAQIFDAGESSGTHYLAMRYVSGQTLNELVRADGPLSVAEAIDAVAQAADILAYAHGQGVIHRDVKPSNFIRDEAGRIHLLDLGLASLTPAVDGTLSIADSQIPEPTSEPTLTRAGQFLGTPDYVAPEMTDEQPQATPQADIYALGAVLHFLLTGKPLFPSGSLIDKLVAHRTEPPPSLIKARSKVPAYVEAIYFKMVAKDPSDRYSTCANVAADLRADDTVSRPHAKNWKRSGIVTFLLASGVGAAIWSRVGIDDGNGTSAAPALAALSDRKVLATTMSVSSLPTTSGRDPGLPNPGKQEAAIPDIIEPDPFSTWPPAVGPPINVIANTDCERDAIQGAWTRADGKLFMPSMPYARLSIGPPPSVAYHLHLELVRKVHGGSLSIGLVVDGHQCEFGMDGVHYTGGLALLDGKVVSEREFEDKKEAVWGAGKRLPVGPLHVIDILVTSDRVAVQCNGEPYIDWTGSADRLSLHNFWKTRDKTALYVGGYTSEIVYHKIEITPLDIDSTSSDSDD